MPVEDLEKLAKPIGPVDLRALLVGTTCVADPSLVKP